MHLAHVLWESAAAYLHNHERLYAGFREPRTHGALNMISSSCFPLSCVMDSCAEGNIHLVQWALKDQPKSVVDDELTEGGSVALAHGHPETFMQLVHMGLEPSADHMDVAAWHGHTGIVKWAFHNRPGIVLQTRLAILAVKSGQWETMMEIVASFDKENPIFKQCAKELVEGLLQNYIEPYPEPSDTVLLYCKRIRPRSSHERWLFVQQIVDAYPNIHFELESLYSALTGAFVKGEIPVAWGIYTRWIKNRPHEAELWSKMARLEGLDGLDWLRTHSNDDLEGPVGSSILSIGIFLCRLDIVDWVMLHTQFHRQACHLWCAVQHADVGTVKHLRRVHQFPWSAYTCLLAAVEGRLEILKHLRLDYQPPCPWNTEHMCAQLHLKATEPHPPRRLGDVVGWLCELKVPGHECLVPFVKQGTRNERLAGRLPLGESRLDDSPLLFWMDWKRQMYG
jgi:hypothetical protein